MAKPAPAEWTFLTNHAHVLVCLAQDPEMTMRTVADRVGLTERAVQRIVSELEEGGVLEHRRLGRQNHYRVLGNVPLRHPVEGHKKVKDLLLVLAAPRKKAASR
jgi:DNA-binding Lrp family transcriptional regulator